MALRNIIEGGEQVKATREERLREALFRGAALTATNAGYVRELDSLLGELLAADLGDGDLTVQALDLGNQVAHGAVIAKQAGVAAGLSEAAWLYERAGIRVQAGKKDGDAIGSGETLLDLEGPRVALLACERTALNVMQRMTGIATTARDWQRRVHERSGGATQLVATRKTPWGLLDKRAVHLGGAGTHRLGLWDAILVKNNHLALLARREEDAVVTAARRAWDLREKAGFIEIEVRSKASALAAAGVFAELQAKDPDACPCLLLLDNQKPAEIAAIREALEAAGLIDAVLLEASGNISEDNLEAYASTGVDAISSGALTHSSKAADISQRI